MMVLIGPFKTLLTEMKKLFIDLHINTKIVQQYLYFFKYKVYFTKIKPNITRIGSQMDCDHKAALNQFYAMALPLSKKMAHERRLSHD